MKVTRLSVVRPSPENYLMSKNPPATRIQIIIKQALKLVSIFRLETMMPWLLRLSMLQTRSVAEMASRMFTVGGDWGRAPMVAADEVAPVVSFNRAWRRETVTDAFFWVLSF